MLISTNWLIGDAIFASSAPVEDAVLCNSRKPLF